MSASKAPLALTAGFPNVRKALMYNWYTIRVNPLGEIAGSLGDLGTLLPLLTAMTAAGNIDLTATLVFSGVFNILSGAIFGLPIVVQPMKAIASIAISRPLSLHETMGAGLSVSVIVLALSITGLLSVVGKRIPIPLVKGIQLGAGLSLILSAGQQLASLTWVSHWADNYILVLVAFVLLCITSNVRRTPYALLLFVVGIVFAIVLVSPNLPKPGNNLPKLIIPPWEAVKTGFLTAGSGQLPLTILNSIIAVTYLSSDLMPTRPAPSIIALGVSVGCMNIVGCLFGAMPVCHGSGGLAGQHRFGARSGASVMILGVVKMFFGFLFGSTMVALLTNFPKSFLAILVFAAGSELAKVGEDINSTARDLWIATADDLLVAEQGNEGLKREPDLWERKERFTIMLTTAGAVIAVKNDAVGLLAGLICWVGYYLQAWFERKGWQTWRHDGDRSTRGRFFSFDISAWRASKLTSSSNERAPLLSPTN